MSSSTVSPFAGKGASEGGEPDRGGRLLVGDPLGRDEGDDGTTSARDHEGLAAADPFPRRMDLMIAAIASARDLPLYTRNTEDFKGLDHIVTVVAV